MKRVDVLQGEIEIKNVAGFAYDYNNFQLLINNTVWASQPASTTPAA